jgi:hypothetical protein
LGHRKTSLGLRTQSSAESIVYPEITNEPCTCDGAVANPACGVHLAAEKKHDAKYKEYNLFYAEVEHVRNQTGIASLMTCYPSTTMVKMSLEDFNKFWKSLERQKSLTIQALLDDGDDDPPCAF